MSVKTICFCFCMFLGPPIITPPPDPPFAELFESGHCSLAQSFLIKLGLFCPFSRFIRVLMVIGVIVPVHLGKADVLLMILITFEASNHSSLSTFPALTVTATIQNGHGQGPSLKATKPQSALATTLTIGHCT